MDVQICVQCLNKKPVNTTDNRLVTENCGHVKCMDCLLNEKQGCIACASKTDLQTVGIVKNNISDQSNDLLQKTGKRVLPSHIKVGTDETGKNYTCTICKKTFRARCQIGYHSYCDAKRKLPYKCTFCDKKFVSHSHYKYHMNIHFGEKPFACNICGLSFCQLSKLRRHKLKHTGEKKYACELCNKAFNNGSALRKHRLTHTGERPYACAVCALRFSDVSNLRKHHLARHHGKALWCEPCGGEVSSRRMLASHWRAHARAPGRPYACSHCSCAFAQRRDLLRHEIVHSDQLPYSCKVCVRAFKRKDNLERHIRNAHPDEDTAAAVLVDEVALSSHRTLPRAPPPRTPSDAPALAKSQLEVLNPLPPLDRDLIQKHMGPPSTPAPPCEPAPAPRPSEDADSYIKCIMEANNARESVIFAPLKLAKERSQGAAESVGPSKASECEYVHKIRKAHCMVTQKDMDLPPIDETKIIELERKTNMNKLDVGSPPKNMEVYKKILLEAPAQDESSRPHPPPTSLGSNPLHWRTKMKLNAHWSGSGTGSVEQERALGGGGSAGGGVSGNGKGRGTGARERNRHRGAGAASGREQERECGRRLELERERERALGGNGNGRGGRSAGGGVSGNGKFIKLRHKSNSCTKTNITRAKPRAGRLVYI